MNSVQIVFALACLALALAGPAQHVSVIQDTIGNYNVDVNVDGMTKVEQGSADGSVRGSYSYVDPAGQVHSMQYTSGVDGYRAAGSDIPVPVQDTPEVAEVKRSRAYAI